MKSRDRMISPRQQEVRQEDQRQSFGVIQNLQVREKKTNRKKFKSWPVKYEKNQGKVMCPQGYGNDVFQECQRNQLRQIMLKNQVRKTKMKTKTDH